MSGTALTWEESDWLWNDNPFTWGEIFLVEQVAVSVSKGSDINKVLNADDQKRFIKLVCKVKGIETYSGQKTINDDIEVTADDINLVVKKVLGIDLMVENINV